MEDEIIGGSPPNAYVDEIEVTKLPDGSERVVTRHYSPEAFREKLNAEMEIQRNQIEADTARESMQQSFLAEMVELKHEKEMEQQRSRMNQIVPWPQYDAQRYQMMEQQMMMLHQMEMAWQQNMMTFMGFRPGMAAIPNNQSIGSQPQIGYSEPTQSLPPPNPQKIMAGQSNDVQDVEYEVRDDALNMGVPIESQINIPPSKSDDGIDFNSVFNSL